MINPPLVAFRRLSSLDNPPKLHNLSWSLIYKSTLSALICVASIYGHALDVAKTELSSNHQVLAIAWEDEESEQASYIKTYDINTGKQISTIHDASDWLRSLHFNNAGTKLVTGHANGDVRVWDVTTGVKLASRKLNSIEQAYFYKDNIVVLNGSYLTTLTEDLSQILSQNTLALVLPDKTDIDKAKAIVSSNFRYMPYRKYGMDYRFFEEDGKFLLQYDSNDTIVVLDIATQSPLGDIVTDANDGVQVSPRDNEIWTYEDEQIHIYDISRLKQTAFLNFSLPSLYEISDINFMPEGKTALILFTTDDDTSNLILLDMQEYRIKDIIKFDSWRSEVKPLNNSHVIMLGSRPEVWDIDKQVMVRRFVD